MEGKLRSWPRRSRGRPAAPWSWTVSEAAGHHWPPPLSVVPVPSCLPAHRSVRGRLVWPLPGETLPGAVVLTPPISTWAAQPGSAQVPAPRPVSSLFRPQCPQLQTGPTRTSQGRAVFQYLLLTHCVFSKQSLVLLEHLIFNRFVFPKKREPRGFIMYFKK